jgi:demethylmenaquinone methyltransferase/2-methoxy-6-polyprenyl-1,4-benzoquinol methylase
MPLREIPHWFNDTERREQLDDHVVRTGHARFGRRVLKEDEKTATVSRHFSLVAPKYDFMNSLLSFGIQLAWKRAAIRMLSLKPGDRVLDVCGGTGDLALFASRSMGSRGQVIIYDINWHMLVTGRPKLSVSPFSKNITCVQGNAESIAFGDNHFDAAMVGFGIRNLTHLERGFAEMVRVLKPGGKILCLEFSRPVNPVFRYLYDVYSFKIMPLLGKLIVGSAQAYACLPETIRMFPLPDELSSILKRLGCKGVRYQRMTNGIAVVHVAEKR